MPPYKTDPGPCPCPFEEGDCRGAILIRNYPDPRYDTLRFCTYKKVWRGITFDATPRFQINWTIRASFEEGPTVDYNPFFQPQFGLGMKTARYNKKDIEGVHSRIRDAIKVARALNHQEWEVTLEHAYKVRQKRTITNKNE